MSETIRRLSGSFSKANSIECNAFLAELLFACCFCDVLLQSLFLYFKVNEITAINRTIAPDKIHRNNRKKRFYYIEVITNVKMTFKNLFVNKSNFSECYDRSCHEQQCLISLVKLFKPHQNLTKTIEPGVRYFYNPSASLVIRVISFLLNLFVKLFYMRNILFG